MAKALREPISIPIYLEDDEGEKEFRRKIYTDASKEFLTCLAQEFADLKFYDLGPLHVYYVTKSSLTAELLYKLFNGGF